VTRLIVNLSTNRKRPAGCTQICGPFSALNNLYQIILFAAHGISVQEGYIVCLHKIIT